MAEAMTPTERAYVRAYRDVVACVCDVRRYVSTPLRQHVDALEQRIAPERIEELREIAAR